MAEQTQDSDGGALSGGMKLIVFSASMMARFVTAPLRFLTSDKALNGFFRQGVKELGNTFGQMAPDSQTAPSEPGGIWNPLHADLVAGDKKPFKHFYSADHTIHTPGNRPRTPGEIARSNQPYDPGQSPGKEQDNGLEP